MLIFNLMAVYKQCFAGPQSPVAESHEGFQTKLPSYPENLRTTYPP